MTAPVVPLTNADGPRAVFLPLPEVTEHLHVVHYATGTRAGASAPTPPVTAIVVQHVLTGAQMTFAAITAAEAARVRPDEFLAKFPDLEREALSAFTDFATTRLSAVWLHWRMRDALFGFDALKQRAAVRRVRHHGIAS